MSNAPDMHFDSVESAHEYVQLLAEVVGHAKEEVSEDVDREANSDLPRRMETLRLLLYNLEKLEQHLKKSSRILNDVRSLRRLLFEERRGKPEVPTKK